jgi:predicted PhzF superfamily epimerase YddE/YHI9
MASATANVKQIIQKVTARVFCQELGTGGNPVTIFSPSCAAASLSTTTQQKLAQSCAWESVMVNTNDNSMAFYMPTGEQVSFCAHAAMGGVMQLIPKPLHDESSQQVAFCSVMQPDLAYHAMLHEHNIVSLDMKADFVEQKIQHPPQLQRILREALQVQASDLVQTITLLSQSSSQIASFRFPTFLNSSIARPKTLVYMSSVDALNDLRAPPVSDAFRIACDALQSTGLYLYAPVDSDDNDHDDTSITLECRQFPRASGYPEDPATGIAAACLAVSLHERGLQRKY